MINYSN